MYIDSPIRSFIHSFINRFLSQFIHFYRDHKYNGIPFIPSYLPTIDPWCLALYLGLFSQYLANVEKLWERSSPRLPLTDMKPVFQSSRTFSHGHPLKAWSVHQGTKKRTFTLASENHLRNPNESVVDAFPNWRQVCRVQVWCEVSGPNQANRMNRAFFVETGTRMIIVVMMIIIIIIRYVSRIYL